MRAAITKTFVESVKPGVVAWDTKLPGFAVRTRSSGRTFYLVKYGIGKRGPFSLAHDRRAWLAVAG
jgi:hypothetical protein